jgi:GT2 family glycosyltransferase
MGTSIVIPTCAREQWLERSLVTLARNLPRSCKHNIEVVVVSNGVPDCSDQVVHSIKNLDRGLNIRHVHEDVPGTLAGRHRGAIETTGDVICYLDDDVEVSKTWFEAIIAPLRDASVDLVGGPCLPVYWGTPPPWLWSFFENHSQERLLCSRLSLIDWGTEECDVDSRLVWTQNCAIRRDSLFRFRGYHPGRLPRRIEEFQGDEETGLSMKITALGGRTRYAPGAMIWHNVPPERMRPSYFEQRERIQGICDSYTSIRKAGGFSMSDPRTDTCNAQATPWTLRRMAQKAKAWIKRRMNRKSVVRGPDSPQDVVLIEQIHEAVRAAYHAGFAFHQERARADERLLKWILRPDYFDCYLPEEGLQALVERSDSEG